MNRYRITVSYDGTNYAGWQVQPSDPTVQQAIQKALTKLSGESAKIHGSGRTDQGVHAVGQVAHFDILRKLPVRAIRDGLNYYLPDDIRIMQAKSVSSTFHARRSAVSKEYRYFVWNGDVMPGHQRLYKTHVRQPLDIEAMKASAALLVGKHDFAAFTANGGVEMESTVRRLFSMVVTKKGHEIVMTAKGEGFLYKMVRSIAGHLISVGRGTQGSKETLGILNSRKRTSHVKTAPSCGLFLWHVTY